MLYKMPRKLFFLLILPITLCYSQEIYVEFPRPTFPDVFQTEVESMFIEDTGVVQVDASLYFDRVGNRAALFMIKDNELTREVFNFDTDESIMIDGNDCTVDKMPDQQGFFPFTVDHGKKKMLSAEEVFFFNKSVLDRQSLSDSGMPTLVYHLKTNISRYGKENCTVTHVFSKPDFQLATCKEGWYCKSILLSLSVLCKNKQGDTEVNHVYRFSRFQSTIEDESVFLPPPGIHCAMKSSLPMPPFPSYFSFTYDIIEKPIVQEKNPPVFKTHKEIWYDGDYNIVRLDEFNHDALYFSSRVYDLKAQIAFSIVSTNPLCDPENVTSDFKLDETTRLPGIFFTQNDTTSGVFVGKRKVNGLDYHVWSVMWTDEESTTRLVEEIYYIQVDSGKDFANEYKQESYYQISHIDMYTYGMDVDSLEYKLVLQKHFSINNYRTIPKEWSAFDVSSCFNKNQTKTFSIKIQKFPLVKGSQSYREVLELFYNKILTATGVSLVRISELTGIFDGTLLLEIRGTILDNSKSSGWPVSNDEPGMDETFKLIAKAGSEGKLDIIFKGQNNKQNKIKVISVEAVDTSPSDTKSRCFSGASMAAASLVLLLIGVSFGIIGYYVFLKKRKLSNAPVRMTELDS